MDSLNFRNCNVKFHTSSGKIINLNNCQVEVLMETEYIEVTSFGSFTKEYIRGEPSYKLMVDGFIEQNSPVNGEKIKLVDTTKLKRSLQF